MFGENRFLSIFVPEDVYIRVLEQTTLKHWHAKATYIMLTM